MKIILTLGFSIGATLSFSQQGSEIYLFDLKIKKHRITVSNPKNITNHLGYDNQPSFHIDQPLLYYSSFNDDGRADIKSYNYQTNKTSTITITKEREYSPTLTPDKKYLSCIIQRDSGMQDLGKYSTEGGEASVIINNLRVGYHVWADNSHVALFVLGSDSLPNTLHYVQLPTKKDTVLAENIGRSLHKVPGERAISFVDKTTQTKWQIKKFNMDTFKIDTIATTPPSHEDIAWTREGVLLSSDGRKLLQLDGAFWKEIVVENKTMLLKDITRLAVSQSGKKLAVVVSE
jgi:Tol biopolymer transport system component